MRKPDQHQPDAFVQELRQQPHGRELEALHYKSLETGRELRAQREESADAQETDAYFRRLQQQRNEKHSRPRRWMPLLSLATAGVAAAFVLFNVNTGIFHNNPTDAGSKHPTISKKMSSKQIASIVLDAFGFGESSDSNADDTSNTDNSLPLGAVASATTDTAAADDQSALWANTDTGDPAPISQALPEPLSFLNDDE